MTKIDKYECCCIFTSIQDFDQNRNLKLANLSFELIFNHF